MIEDTLTFNDNTIYKRVDNIGSVTYVNVVTGAKTVVPWGSVDWINIILSNALSTVVLVGLIWVGLHYLLK